MISARNQLMGKIESIQEGAVNASVTLKTDRGETIVSTISMAAVRELELVPGKQALAVIKATDVMISVANPRKDMRWDKE